MPRPDTRAFTAGLVGKRAAAGVLFVDERQRVLLVEPAYKSYWELPGGVVEAGESPLDAALREVKEELGIVTRPGRLLVVDYFPDRPQATEALMFVFAGAQLSSEDQAAIQLRGEELRSWAWCTPAEVVERTEHAPLLCQRIGAAWRAHRDRTTSYLDDGRRVDVP